MNCCLVLHFCMLCLFLFTQVCRMLRSSQPLYLKVEKTPDVSELDYRHKLQLKLLVLVRRYAPLAR
jgi:hypothetical protein